MCAYNPQSYRGQHRQRSDDDGHQQAEQEEKLVLPEHPLIPQNQAQVVADSAGLAKLVAEIREAGSMAYDSEFIGEQYYFPRICVIQVATPTKVTLVDAVAEIDLGPFWELLADVSVAKIVHAGFQDLEPVVRFCNLPPRNVYDTQVAAAFAGHNYPIGLAALILKHLNLELGKGLKFSQWDRRPLTAVQMRYAANDVRFLHAIHAELEQSIADLGHTQRVKQEMEDLSEIERYRHDPVPQFMRIRGAETLRRRQMAILKELTIWRDQSARAHNVPVRTFLKDVVVLELARRSIHRIEDLSHIRGLPRPLELESGHEIFAAIERGRAAKVDELPFQQDNDLQLEYKAAVDHIWHGVLECCKAVQIDPGMVASRREVARWYYRVMTNQSVQDCPLLRGWRGELLADVLHSD